MRQVSDDIFDNYDYMSSFLSSLRIVSGKDLNPYLAAELTGILLVLKKKGLFGFNPSDSNITDVISEKIGESHFSDSLMSILPNLLTEIEESIYYELFKKEFTRLAILTFNEDEYLHYYDYFINELFEKYSPIGPFSEPENFSRLVDALLPDNTQTIFNPFGWTMYMPALMERFTSMDAWEQSRDIWAIGLLRLELSEKAEKISFENSTVEKWTPKVYDAIVAMPPLGSKIKMQSSSPLFPDNKPEESELVAPVRFVESTGENGCCITFVSPTVLWNAGTKNRFREWATVNKYIDTIILLPKNLLSSTNIAVACLVLRKKPLHKDGVRMVNASAYFTSKRHKNILCVDDILNAYQNDVEKVSATIPYERIERNDFSWNIDDYLNIPEVECPEGYTSARIEDIAHFPEATRPSSIKTGHYIRIADLTDDWIHPYIDVDSREKRPIAYGTLMLTEDAVLVSTIRSLKPSIIKASVDHPVFLAKDILAIIPNENLDLEYLCMYLSKATIPTVGMGVPYISKSKILHKTISFPDLEHQRSVYREARKAAMLEQAQSLHLGEVIAQMKSEYMDEVRLRKHDMKPYIKELSCACKNLELYLAHTDDIEEKELFEGMRAEVSKQVEALASLTALLNIFSREEKFGEPELINIDEFLMNHYFDGENYQSDYDPDYQAFIENGFNVAETLIDPIISFVDGKVIFDHSGPEFVEGANVFMAKDDLKRLFDNIINNAVKHGFTDPERWDYNITTYLTIDAERDMYQIDVVNNGNPLPKGMDKKRYGLKGEKAGKTGGTGNGGYIVKSIVEHYGGDYDIFFTEENNRAYTTVRVFLPIHRVDEM